MHYISILCHHSLKIFPSVGDLRCRHLGHHSLPLYQREQHEQFTKYFILLCRKEKVIEVWRNITVNKKINMIFHFEVNYLFKGEVCKFFSFFFFVNTFTFDFYLLLVYHSGVYLPQMRIEPPRHHQNSESGLLRFVNLSSVQPIARVWGVATVVDGARGFLLVWDLGWCVTWKKNECKFKVQGKLCCI